jgi:hypothetical protein
MPSDGISPLSRQRCMPCPSTNITWPDTSASEPPLAADPRLRYGLRMLPAASYDLLASLTAPPLTGSAILELKDEAGGYVPTDRGARRRSGGLTTLTGVAHKVTSGFALPGLRLSGLATNQPEPKRRVEPVLETRICLKSPVGTTSGLPMIGEQENASLTYYFGRTHCLFPVIAAPLR